MWGCVFYDLDYTQNVCLAALIVGGRKLVSLHRNVIELDYFEDRTVKIISGCETRSLVKLCEMQRNKLTGKLNICAFQLLLFV
ncbi:hypothetical protein NPIL_168941 [Nephila pilipes]|uniref:Uncharacterized protein n=1 Tax=Nephila pilipes TaxID=299642 RepID=A0A8X6UCN6_NEPPI|nr:hypothetical protein NPIL_168941 [Nephila pilipes]